MYDHQPVHDVSRLRVKILLIGLRFAAIDCSRSSHRLFKRNIQRHPFDSHILLHLLINVLLGWYISQLSKELEQGCSRLEISKWAQERFKESKSIASPEALYKMYASQY